MSVSPAIAVGGGALAGSLVLFLWTLRWSVRSLRRARQRVAFEGERRARELARVEEREAEAACSWAGYRKFQVSERVEENRDGSVVTFVLTPFRKRVGVGSRLPKFLPGQYVQIRVDVPGQASLLTRCYSLSGDYKPESYQLTVALAKGGTDSLTGSRYPAGVVSTYLIERVKERAVLDLTVPQGDFHLDVASRDPVVLIGWGIRAIPLVPIFSALARTTQREVWFFLEVPGEAQLLSNLLDPLFEIVRADKTQRLKVWISFAGEDTESDLSRGASGRFSAQHMTNSGSLTPDTATRMESLVFRDGRQAVAWVKRVIPPHYQTTAGFYVSGPATLLREAKHDLGDWGVPDENVRFEVFDRESLDAIADVEEDAGASQVTFESSRKTAPWDADMRNLLTLGASVKVRIPSTCKIGKCGECQVPLISGKVRYSSQPECKLQPGNCLPCVAVPASSSVVLGA